MGPSVLLSVVVDTAPKLMENLVLLLGNHRPIRTRFVSTW